LHKIELNGVVKEDAHNRAKGVVKEDAHNRAKCSSEGGCTQSS